MGHIEPATVHIVSRQLIELGARGDFDLTKCFDLIGGAILHAVLNYQNFPQDIVDTLLAFQQQVKLRFQLAQGYGEEWNSSTCIFQGCSLSMLMIHILLRP